MSPSGRSFERSAALYQRALKTIPLGSQTFSKSAMNFVEGAAPLFLDRGKGAHVWDVDGNRYVDLIGGLMPVVLGYCDEDVDTAIRKQLDRGISFTLATELECELAERLVRLIPCAEMVRFGKNGSDATSAAIRLCRAATDRERIALCGYHGWHDWYIGTTTRSIGVPKAVRDLSVAFPYNDADALEALLKADPQAYAAVILEPAGHSAPAPGFLERVRALCDRYGTILVFDEIVTGFRINMGGAQAQYGVTPDLAAFGKAMANGMPISAIVGRRDIMRWMEEIFFSGTFGGETLSLAASIATLDKLERADAPARFRALGERLMGGVAGQLAERGLDKKFSVAGENWWPRVALLDPAPASAGVAHSLLRQELAANGILMGSGFNLSLAHDEQAVIDEIIDAWGRACDAVAAAYNDPDPARHLRGKPIRPVFEVRSERDR